LVKNPEYYTFWNYRRRLMLKTLSSESDNTKNLLTDDLNFLVPLLMQFPKCYWIWNYRLWLLHQAEQHTSLEDTLQFWQQELALVGKMLARDERNFHGWDYRRHIVTQIERLQGPGKRSLAQSEFEYTTKLIRRALQNFSALHYRSKLIPRLLNEQQATQEQRRQMFESELDMMQDALVDPYNQSAWFYHAYLMNSLASSGPSNNMILLDVTEQDLNHYYTQEISRIKEMLEDFDDCKWIYQTLVLYTLDYSRFQDKHQISVDHDLTHWLDELIKLDPSRSGHWEDLKESLSI
jgi:geranylgeranyl transferase type-2 subunit alpha